MKNIGDRKKKTKSNQMANENPYSMNTHLNQIDFDGDTESVNLISIESSDEEEKKEKRREPKKRQQKQRKLKEKEEQEEEDIINIKWILKNNLNWKEEELFTNHFGIRTQKLIDISNVYYFHNSKKICVYVLKNMLFYSSQESEFPFTYQAKIEIGYNINKNIMEDEKGNIFILRGQYISIYSLNTWQLITKIKLKEINPKADLKSMEYFSPEKIIITGNKKLFILNEDLEMTKIIKYSHDRKQINLALKISDDSFCALVGTKSISLMRFNFSQNAWEKRTAIKIEEAKEKDGNLKTMKLIKKGNFIYLINKKRFFIIRKINCESFELESYVSYDPNEKGIYSYYYFHIFYNSTLILYDINKCASTFSDSLKTFIKNNPFREYIKELVPMNNNLVLICYKDNSMKVFQMEENKP